MRNRKRIYRKFSYRECDSFAAFLREQSRKGWHFKEWKMGLVFERGEKKDVEYDVQVFPKGKDYDYKPEAEAEEYADYCEVAGWEFVDGQGQFCIFRRCGNDAISIVTEEERFRNVCAAEWRQWRRDVIWPALLLSLDLWQWVLCPTSAWGLYDNVILCVIAIFVICLLWSLMDGAWLLSWGRAQKKKLEAGEKVSYHKAGPRAYSLIGLRNNIGIIAIGVLAYQAGHGQVIVPIVFFVLAVSVLDALFEYLRPKRENLWVVAMSGMGLWIIVVFLTGVMLVAERGDVASIFLNGEFTSGHFWQKEDVPLVQEDYKEAGDMGSVEEYFWRRGMFGEMLACKVEYVPEETALSEEERYKLPVEERVRLDDLRQEETDTLRYEIYQSRYRWMIEKVWDIEAGDAELEECSEQWDAAYAGLLNSYCYYVKYEDEVWVITTGERLTDEQIRIVRERLEKIEWGE